jgi:menaquinone-specific isochorismate synthase
MPATLTKTDATQKLYKKITLFFADIEIDPAINQTQFIRLEVRIEKFNPLRWLIQQKDAVKTYWRDRHHTFEMAGIGEADVVAGESASGDSSAIFQRLKKYLHYTSPKLRYYGGIRFSIRGTNDENWKKFGAYRFVVPKFEIYSDKEATYFACNFLFNPLKNYQQQLESILEALNQVSWDLPEFFPRHVGELLRREDLPDRSGWRKNIESALKLFAKRQVEKIVLARKTMLEFSEKLNAPDLLRRLQNTDAAAFHFCFQPAVGRAFIGGSPERLYRRRGREIVSEAVAGTRKRGHSPAEDQYLEKELLNSEKDVREHRFVIDSLRQAFEQLCLKVEERKGLFVLKLSRLQHLYSRLWGILKWDVDDSRIVSKLHPTPAVGGSPTEAAVAEIAELEPFDRGWYAGPVGWVGYNAAEFAVAIRSGLVVDNKLHLYSGAGIVEGSRPEEEWEEIENKIANFIKALDCF